MVKKATRRVTPVMPSPVRKVRRFDGDIYAVAREAEKSVRPALDLLAAYDRGEVSVDSGTAQ